MLKSGICVEKGDFQVVAIPGSAIFGSNKSKEKEGEQM